MHTVRFQAPSTSGDVLPLSWGQERVLDLEDAMRPGHAQLNMRLVIPMRTGVSIDDALRAITRMVVTCHSTRTTYVRQPGSEPLQRLCSAGDLAVIELDVALGDDQSSARALAEELAAQPLADDALPLRVAVVSAAGEPRQLVMAVRHIAVDYFGLPPLLEALGDLINTEARDGRDRSPVSQPADIVAWERSLRGRNAGARASRRNARTFEEMPASMVPRPPGTPEAPRYRYVRLESRCLTSTLGHLANRHGVSETSVLYGALSVVLTHVSGLDRAHWQVCTANRLDRTSASAVASLTQDIPTWVDVSDHDFVAVLERSSRALLDATLHGRFPHAGLAATRAAGEARRGVALDCSYWINSRLSGNRVVRTTLTACELGRLRDDALLVIEPGGDITSTSTAFVYADRRDDTTTLRMLVDTAYVPTNEARAWLGAVDALLLHALDGETDTRALAVTAGQSTPPPDPQWALVDHSRIHLPTVLACLLAAGAPVESVRVEDEARADAPAILIATARDLDAAVVALRGVRVGQVIGQNRGAMLPHAVDDGTGGRVVLRDATPSPG